MWVKTEQWLVMDVVWTVAPRGKLPVANIYFTDEWLKNELEKDRYVNQDNVKECVTFKFTTAVAEVYPAGRVVGVFNAVDRSGWLVRVEDESFETTKPFALLPEYDYGSLIN